jgi:23S rRNA pseudouridine1911/1915/1917 synthase
MVEPEATFEVLDEQAGQTLAALLRLHLPGKSWSEVRKLVASRRVQISGSLVLDPARRLKSGERIELLIRPVAQPKTTTTDGLVIRHLDEHLVVVEKTSGINTVRHPAERDWKEQRRELSPTLEDLTQKAIAARLSKHSHTLPRLRIVHRLDKETSGLVVFARSALAERLLGKQFHAHSVIRRYQAIIPGLLVPQTIETYLVRDRGDGRRGSGSPEFGKQAITHLELIEKLPSHSLVMCQLETGRTHQIRIHLSEAGHPVCGERVYNRDGEGAIIEETITPPRLALHAFELGFEHPETLENVFWEMPLPDDLKQFLEKLRTLPTRKSK